MRKLCAFAVLPDALRKVFEVLPGIEFVPGHLGITFAKALHRGLVPPGNRDVLACLEALIAVNAYTKADPDSNRPRATLENCGTCRIAFNEGFLLRIAPVEPVGKYALLLNIAIEKPELTEALITLITSVAPTALTVEVDPGRGLPDGFETFVEAAHAPMHVQDAIRALRKTPALC